MNYALAKEIYGMQPWCVDQHTYPALMGMIQNLQNGVVLELPEIKYNSPQLVELSSKTYLVSHTEQLHTESTFEAIGLINIDGPISVSGGASSYGMAYVSKQMHIMARDSRIKSFIVYGNSGGGSSAAVEIMTDTINEIKELKAVYGLIKKGGIAASAMYGILSACTAIYAESEMSIVGSVGTIIEFQGRKANTEDQNGVKYIRRYASASTHKNRWYEEALNNDDYTAIDNEMLKPINDRFLKLVENNRPLLKGTAFDNGHSTFAKDAIGNFIDGIQSFESLVQQISSTIEVQSEGPITNTNQQNIKAMTVSELKQNHFETYNSIFNAGVSAGEKSEKDRVGVWMAHYDTDSKIVQKGINSGEAISATQREQLLVLQNSGKRLKSLEQESPNDVITNEDKDTETSNKEEIDAFYSDIDSKLKTGIHE